MINKYPRIWRIQRRAKFVRSWLEIVKENTVKEGREILKFEILINNTSVPAVKRRK